MPAAARSAITSGQLPVAQALELHGAVSDVDDAIAGARSSLYAHLADRAADDTDSVIGAIRDLAAAAAPREDDWTPELREALGALAAGFPGPEATNPQEKAPGRPCLATVNRPGAPTPTEEGTPVMTQATAPAQQQTSSACLTCNGTRTVQVQIYNTPINTWVTITQACPDCL